MNVGIIGAGFVGLTLATILGSRGYNTTLMDSNVNKINKIEKGIIPFYEPKLEKLLQKALKKSLNITTDSKYIVNKCKIIFVTVGTPTLADGKSNLNHNLINRRVFCICIISINLVRHFSFIEGLFDESLIILFH